METSSQLPAGSFTAHVFFLLGFLCLQQNIKHSTFIHDWVTQLPTVS